MSRHSPYAFPLLFVAGVLTSIGPCTAPRMIAVAGLSTAQRANRLRQTVAFATGILAVYAGFASIGALLVSALTYSSWLYGGVGLALCAGGLTSLLRNSPHAVCRQEKTAIPTGAALLLGASSALVISPCCTPVLVSVIAYGGAIGNVPFTAASIAAFGLGHTMPVIAVGAAGGLCKPFERFSIFQSALSTVGGALMLCLGAYYLVLV